MGGCGCAGACVMKLTCIRHAACELCYSVSTGRIISSRYEKFKPFSCFCKLNRSAERRIVRQHAHIVRQHAHIVRQHAHNVRQHAHNA